MRTLGIACLLVGAGLLASLAGCEHRPPTPGSAPPPPPPAVASTAPAAPAGPAGAQQRAVVPRGCDINLRGTYRLAGRPARRYQIEDDGTHLVARPTGDGALDGGSPQDEAMAMVLDRTPQGFVGLLVGNARTAGGKVCPVAFRAEIRGCDGDGIRVWSDEAVALDGQCGLRRLEGRSSEKLLVRE